MVDRSAPAAPHQVASKEGPWSVFVGGFGMPRAKKSQYTVSGLSWESEAMV
jgi:hypothetical protein